MPTLRLPLLAAVLLALVSASAPAEAQRRSAVSTRVSSPARPFSDVERRGSLLARRLSVGLDEARQTRRRQTARCLSDHLSQVHSLLRQVELRQGRALPAPRLARLTQVFQERLGALDVGSRRCQGGQVSDGEGTVVRTEVDASVPQEDPTRLPSGPEPLFSLPVIPAPLSPTI